jgi:hypothetical protein
MRERSYGGESEGTTLEANLWKSSFQLTSTPCYMLSIGGVGGRAALVLEMPAEELATPSPSRIFAVT